MSTLTSNYTRLPNGFWVSKADGSGPYVFDGANFFLVPYGQASSLSTTQLNAGATGTAGLDSSGNLYTLDGLAHQIINSVGGIFPTISQMQRVSAGTANDTTEQVIGSIFVPGALLQLGTELRLNALLENTNSSSQKNQLVRIGPGLTSMGNQQNTTNTETLLFYRAVLEDANTLRSFNSLATASGVNANASITATAIDAMINGVSFAINGKWTAQPSAGEIIKITYAHIEIVGRP